MDLYCSGSLTLKKEEWESPDASNVITYEVGLVLEIKNNQRQIIGRPFTGTGQAQRKVFIGLDGKILGGFNQKDEKTAVHEAVQSALKKAMVFFGNEFPVSGAVTGYAPQIDPNRMQINKGVEDGLSLNNNLVLWTMISGIAYPLAYARAEPGGGTSAIQIFKWNDNSSLRDWINAVRQPGWLGGQNKLYVTSLGLSYPQEWEQR